MVINITDDPSALAALRRIAQEQCYVSLVITDCGCHAVSAWAGSVKVVEEDRDLATAVRALVERLENDKHIQS